MPNYRKTAMYLGLGAVIALGLSIAVPVALHQPTQIVRPTMPRPLPRLPTEVRFESDGIILAGQILAPEGAPRSAVVIIHGSGTSQRDNGWYGRFAHWLADQGHVVLLPDKRGSALSGGDWRGQSMQTLATDTDAALAEIRARYPDVPTGIVGVSQGGWIAPIVAANDPDLDFVVNLSGSAVPAVEQLVAEEVNTMSQDMGLPRWAAHLLAPLTSWNIRANVDPELWAHLDDFDATPLWAEVRQPTFIAYGALDEYDNVPVARSVENLENLGNSAIALQVYEGVGHGLFRYSDGEFLPQVLIDLARFIDQQAD